MFVLASSMFVLLLCPRALQLDLRTWTYPADPLSRITKKEKAFYFTILVLFLSLNHAYMRRNKRYFYPY